MTKSKSPFRDVFLTTIVIGVVMHLVHEASHMLGAMTFGVGGSMGTNTVNYDADMSETARLWASIAGPGSMILIAIAARAMQWRWTAIILYVVFIQRSMAGIVTWLAGPNDEARIGQMLGLGEWPVFALTIGLSGLLFAAQYGQERLGWRFLLAGFLGMSVALPLVVFADPILPRINF
ncbi:hypothetical protein [Sphingomicrobium clamense]|uniref:Uncharacterized protein n=1 Tax=Sphingomicrobium clamense TaxID=2851013 RepID=A0ABS6V552_9SPHN|nr:hypothetical protein [Sphingomicrobium sp. B8]MBW0144676.1 hypothetical protein [Sphingomicrobium sp. B8]